MSGGHFDEAYAYLKINDFADELETCIKNNSDNFGEETLAYLRSQVPLLKQTASIMRQIDYLYSGDSSEETFMEEVKAPPKPQNLAETLKLKPKYISKEEYAYRYGHFGNITWSSPLCIDHRVTRSTQRSINSFNWANVTEATVSLGAEIVETTAKQLWCIYLTFQKTAL